MMSEKDLKAGLISRDDKAFRELVETYQDKVFRTCMGFLHHTEEAEDITQEVFIEIFRSIDKFRSEAKIATWLYRITVNKSLNQLKKHNRHGIFQGINHYFNPDKNEFNDALQNVSSKETDYISEKEISKALKNAIGSLPENQRIAFVLFKYDELSYSEIAEVMDVSLPAVESMLHRAKLNLQNRLLTFYKKFLN